MKKAFLAGAALLVAAGQASAQLVVTEVMSFSATFPDWFEVTNLGGATHRPDRVQDGRQFQRHRRRR